MARPAAASWRVHAHPPKDMQADLRRWRSCGAGALASGTQSKFSERRVRYRGTDDKAAKAEVRVVYTDPDAVQAPVRAVQPAGGLMVRRLSLAGCELATDDTLATVLRITDLTQLCLDRCVRLTDDALESVATQPGLRELSLAGCRQVGSAGVAHLRALPALRVLSLERCGRVTDEGLLRALPEWRRLQVLNVAFCYKLTVKSLGNVGACARLAYLDVRSTRVNSELWRAVRSLRRLRALYASNTGVGEDGVDALQSLPALKALDVAGAQVGDRLLAAVARLELETLNLSYTLVSDAGVAKHVTRMRSLRWLSLDDTDVGDHAVERMGALCELTSLNVADTSVTAFGVAAVAALPALRALDLSFTGVTDAALRALARLGGLRKLAADGEHVTDAGAQHLGALTELRELELYGAGLTDAGAASIARCTQLRTLELCLARVGDRGAQSLADGLPRLRVANLSQNRLRTPGVVALLAGCRGLETLNVAYCQDVAADVVPALLAHPALACVCLQRTAVGAGKAAALRQAGLVVVCEASTHAHA